MSAALADNKTAFDNLLAYAAANGYRDVYIPPGAYTFKSRPARITAAVCIRTDAVFGSGAQLCRDYAPADPDEIFLDIAAYDVSLQWISVVAASGTGGYAIGTKPVGAESSDYANLLGLYITYTGGQWKRPVSLDGTLRTYMYGVRDWNIVDCSIFGGTEYTVYGANVVSLTVKGGGIFSGGSAPTANIKIGGVSGRLSQNCRIDTSFGSTVDINYADSVAVTIGYVSSVVFGAASTNCIVNSGNAVTATNAGTNCGVVSGGRVDVGGPVVGTSFSAPNAVTVSAGNGTATLQASGSNETRLGNGNKADAVRVGAAAGAVNGVYFGAMATGANAQIGYTAGSDANAGLDISARAAGTIRMMSDLYGAPGVEWVFQRQVTGATDSFWSGGGSSGTNPTIGLTGTSATINANLKAKGGGGWNYYGTSGADLQAQIGGGSQSAVNAWKMSGGVTGSTANLDAVGADLDIWGRLAGKGATGVVFGGGGTATAQPTFPSGASGIFAWPTSTGECLVASYSAGGNTSLTLAANPGAGKAPMRVFQVYGNPAAPTQGDYFRAFSLDAGSGAKLATTGGPLILEPYGTNRLQFNNSFVANGGTAASLGSTSPGNAAPQEWLAVKNASGTVRYIPAF